MFTTDLLTSPLRAVRKLRQKVWAPPKENGAEDALTASHQIKLHPTRLELECETLDWMGYQ